MCTAYTCTCREYTHSSSSHVAALELEKQSIWRKSYFCQPQMTRPWRDPRHIQWLPRTAVCCWRTAPSLWHWWSSSGSCAWGSICLCPFLWCLSEYSDGRRERDICSHMISHVINISHSYSLGIELEQCSAEAWSAPSSLYCQQRTPHRGWTTCQPNLDW